MASVTSMTASFIGGATLSHRSPATTCHRRLIVNSARTTTVGENVKISHKSKDESNSGRRDLVFATAAAAVCSIAGVAMAGEPKRGSLEAKKIYAPVCVTMPTARICHK
ncbi:photosystem II 5 kDa protein, chloroplastic-like [Actinidia eriantha]|uniref:photosystem II 5 kDa protein, chloroplastic-like n=1 Tax=Actinidia eriantha TaxID=165200 RepID=UPI0025851CBE|nr:photosystem II 5 kDa protein, chloroplastic-like [Actinidia eriantha]